MGIHAVVQSLIPALLAGSSPKRLVYISSTSASMERQIGAKAGLQGPYSVSKAAGNMLMIQYYNALHANTVAVGLIHPGWVATDMRNTAGDGGMPVEKSVKGIIEVVESKLSFENSPLFVKWEGAPLPW
ncbi:hypothetical protein [Sporisorium scitamineum]|nr:hypothetical protein [Sporisorium scitamineum]